jgi:hypothetical protein
MSKTYQKSQPAPKKDKKEVLAKATFFRPQPKKIFRVAQHRV